MTTDQDDEDFTDYVPARLRRLQKLSQLEKLARESRLVTERLLSVNEPAADVTDVGAEGPKSPNKAAEAEHSSLQQEEAPKESLLSSNLRAPPAEVDDDELAGLKAEEARLFEQIRLSLSTPLVSVKERARGVQYESAMKTSWTVPRKYAALGTQKASALRERLLIDLEGDDAPPPILKFEQMKLPSGILQQLHRMDISTPTPIQMQGLPCVLSGRDLIGIASTGSGKTLVFVIPMVLRALEAELKARLKNGEGPIGVVICPSRELAAQTASTVTNFARSLTIHDNAPKLRTLLVIGGTSAIEQTEALRRGVHLLTATPGRLNDMLTRKRMHLRQCVYLTLDEADRLVDLGFEEEIRSVFDHFTHQRQTLLFSATMPRKIQEFATSALVHPIMCNVGRAGAASLDVKQVVEYVKAHSRLPFLLECLQNTAPPVVIFCEHKRDVDAVHEYLLLKGVDAVAIHGGLSQFDRYNAINEFKNGIKDVLIGTDVASKGLDFPEIQHVINFDMPRDIENYVHRIGRTGRRGKRGLATTFINRHCDEGTLMDLRALLKEAKQPVPTFLDALTDARPKASGDLHVTAVNTEIGGVRGCAYCGGLGHRIVDCSKLDSQRNKHASSKRDLLGSGTRYGGSSAYDTNW